MSTLLLNNAVQMTLCSQILNQEIARPLGRRLFPIRSGGLALLCVYYV